jgi:hypothetical protein
MPRLYRTTVILRISADIDARQRDATCIFHLPAPLPKLPAARSLVRRRMRVGIAIKKRPDHPLILCAMEARLFPEEIDAALGKRNCHLLRVLAKHQLAGRREEILNDIETPEGLICVLYWLFHTSADLASNTQRRKYE